MFLSLLLWVNFGQKEAVRQLEIQVPLRFENVPSAYVVTFAPETVGVLAEGTSSQLARIDSAALSAQVDLAQGLPGPRVYTISLTVPSSVGVGLSLKNALARVTLDKLREVTFPVTVEAIGDAPSELRYDGATIQPKTVTVRLPEASLKTLKRVKAVLELKKLQPGTTSVQVPVVVLDSRDRPVPFAKTDPTTVNIFPGLAAAPSSKNLLINPKWKGALAFGYTVSAYTIAPLQLKVVGKSGVIGSLQSLETEPIDLTNASTNFTRKVRVSLPEGVEAIPGTTVEITVIIQRQSEIPATKP
ncbi:MAG: hypothetical protein K8R88_06090 [Armatimonadetes bacterium]|nr:hypothetical protein [Armatimonadota bacterium]